MKRGLCIRLLVCVAGLGIFLMLFLGKQIQLTRLRLQIPALSKEVRAIQEQNTRLAYEIDQFESPENLINISRKPDFSYLKHPSLNEIIEIPSP